MSFHNNNNKRFTPPQRSTLGRSSWHHNKKTPKIINQPRRSNLRNTGRFVRFGYNPIDKEIDEECGMTEIEDGRGLDGRTFTGHRDSISDTEDYMDHPMMAIPIASHVEPEMNKKTDTMRKDQRVYAMPQRHRPRRKTAVKARPRTFHNTAATGPSIPQDLPLSMYDMSLEHYGNGYNDNVQDYVQPQQRRQPQTAFPSLATYGRKVDHAGIGLYITNSYLDHFSCTTLSYLIVGCILCIIIALVIAILVVAFTG